MILHPNHARFVLSSAQAVVRIIARVAGKGVVAAHGKVRAVAADPDDDRILECAVDGKAAIAAALERKRGQPQTGAR